MRTCPVCGKAYEGRPALSRKDNATGICPRCGLAEVLEASGMPGETIREILKEIGMADSRKGED